jgi:hypothetical protein
VKARNAGEMVQILRALTNARHVYDDAFEMHATAEQLAVFHGDAETATRERDALNLVLRRGDEELDAKPFVEGAW